jgi:hypothetical protein
MSQSLDRIADNVPPASRWRSGRFSPQDAGGTLAEGAAGFAGALFRQISLA